MISMLYTIPNLIHLESTFCIKVKKPKQDHNCWSLKCGLDEHKWCSNDGVTIWGSNSRRVAVPLKE